MQFHDLTSRDLSLLATCLNQQNLRPRFVEDDTRNDPLIGQQDGIALVAWINFSIRIQNVGDSAVNQIVLADNLTTRLEYVEESQECTVDAEFETTANEGESLKLQWMLTEPLDVGDDATITFRCKVR